MESMTKYLDDQTIKGTLEIEVASTPEARKKGLSGVDKMDNYQGMLFIYPDITNDTFWGKGLNFDLDIAFISDRGEIVDIRQVFANNLDSVKSSVPYLKALEVHMGWFEHHDISIGHRVLHKGTKLHII